MYREPSLPRAQRQEMNVPQTWLEMGAERKRPRTMAEMLSLSYDPRAELDAGNGRGAR